MSDIKTLMAQAGKILTDWKGDRYVFGDGVLPQVGGLTRPFGQKALLVVADLDQPWMAGFRKTVEDSLAQAGVSGETILGAGPNTPLVDVYRIAMHLARTEAEVAVALGGGSTIDAVRAATILSTYSPAEVRKGLGASEALAGTIEPYVGMHRLAEVVKAAGRPIKPFIAVMTAAGSGAHLTMASNITDQASHQKRLIIDQNLFAAKAVFDYSVTLNSPRDLTLDGGLDGIAHVWEVLTGGIKLPNYPDLLAATEVAMRLIVWGLQRLKKDPRSLEARVALGLGTDVGGYLLMKGAGTHGPHLGSFSLVDILSHGRACAVLNPYYTVLYAEATQEPLRMAAQVFSDAGYLEKGQAARTGRDLGLGVAQAMIAMWQDMGFPTTLKDCGATPAHLERMLRAAKNPQLKMKLQQMPVPMDADKGDVDRLMKPTLEAAFSGDFSQLP